MSTMNPYAAAAASYDVRNGHFIRLGRKRIILQSLEHCSGEYEFHDLWEKLDPEERQDNEIVYKFLSLCDEVNVPCFFPSTCRLRLNYRVELSAKSLSDPRAILACLSTRRKFSSGRDEFECPPSLRDNKAVMMAVCAKFPGQFEMASPELRDDGDLVRLVLCQEYARDHNIEHVSKRLLRDPSLWSHVQVMEYWTPSFAQSWLRSTKLGEMGLQEQKEIAPAILRCVSILDDLTLGFVSDFSIELRDDAFFMLPFIQRDWQTLQFCSDRLRGDHGFFGVAVSRNINAYRYAEGDILADYVRKRTFDFVLDELANGLHFDNVPLYLRGEPRIILAALKAGQKLGVYHFPDALKNDVEFILEVIGHHSDIRELLYHDFSMQLRQDVDVAKALLEAGHPNRQAILRNVPSLLQSRETMLSAMAFPASHDHLDEAFADVISECDPTFLDDEVFMLKAFQSCRFAFRHASNRLRSNREFVTDALALSLDCGYGSSFIAQTTNEFQVQNPDLIQKAILQNITGGDWTWFQDLNAAWFQDLNAGVWSNKDVVMSYLRTVRTIDLFDYCFSIPRPISPFPWEWGTAPSPFPSDPDIAFLAVKLFPSHLKYTSQNLQNDREFILSLVKENYRVLKFAPESMRDDREFILACLKEDYHALRFASVTLQNDRDFILSLVKREEEDASKVLRHAYAATGSMKHDHEILIEVMARNAAAPFAFFNSLEKTRDFRFLDGFSTKLRSAIMMRDCMTDPSCLLSRLNQGDRETGGASLQTLVAEYADMPLLVGPELHSLQAALSNMEKFGF